jgi:hypothetical protein
MENDANASKEAVSSTGSPRVEDVYLKVGHKGGGLLFDYT